MSCRCLTKNTDVIIYSNNTREPVGDVIYLHLEHILAHLLTKWHMGEPVSSLMDVKVHLCRASFIQVDGPEVVLCI